MTHESLSSLSDADLLSTTRLAARTEREATARLVALLEAVDSRRLYLAEGYSSMFAFCTRALHMSEHAAYARIEAARIARRFPAILERLADGRLSVTNVGLLAPHLDEENCDAVLEAAQYQSKREVERLIVAMHPQPAVPSAIRPLPSKVTAPAVVQGVISPAPLPIPSAAAVHPRGAVVAPLSPRSYLLRVTLSESTHRKLERARDLLRHEIPDGDLAAIIDRALTLLVTQAERTKFAATTRKSTGQVTATTRSRSRRIPSAIRREVWARDQGRCAFEGHDGRCSETGFIEFHHVIPFSAGGPSTTENIQLRCRGHNGYEAERAGLWQPERHSTRSGPS
ncbi:MAG TPA: HNH endonuclease signature motif containing protein [Vicinamibacterales bacterium]|nr:HNH endonuclease signature motif containing protein [Vicinamibacterales bacterium]